MCDGVTLVRTARLCGALRARASLFVSADFDSITTIHRQPVGAGRQPNKFGLTARLCVAAPSVCHPERKRNEVKRNFAEVEVLVREQCEPSQNRRDLETNFDGFP